MSDYISREAVVEFIRSYRCSTDVAFHMEHHLNEIPAADVRPRWIPVGERLPEEWWPVLGLIKFHEKEEPPAQQVLWYLGNGHWREVWRGDMIENDVTHWLPLPEPPKEGK